MLGQPGCWAQYEFVQDTAGNGVSGQAEDAAFEVGQPDGEAGQGAGVVVGADAYSPGSGRWEVLVGVTWG
ncbi:hypothetical protein G3I59_07385 [Amycolatopsis rubida]|uniref:Uncharacterized protein n=1 Tax=Amycolatopsis rubida TaxID=112413 RepID=A0ABX0BJL4_9PSEU|nr:MULTISPECIES: hypothetical protein [Amycolatopsis]NEC55426.1 hypothetical protein [Amycolatopsis rubida]